MCARILRKLSDIRNNIFRETSDYGICMGDKYCKGKNNTDPGAICMPDMGAEGRPRFLNKYLCMKLKWMVPLLAAVLSAVMALRWYKGRPWGVAWGGDIGRLIWGGTGAVAAQNAADTRRGARSRGGSGTRGGAGKRGSGGTAGGGKGGGSQGGATTGGSSSKGGVSSGGSGGKGSTASKGGDASKGGNPAQVNGSC